MSQLAEGEAVVKFNDYTNTFFSILRGKVYIQIDPDNPNRTVELGVGRFFGEMSLIDDAPRSAHALVHETCKLEVRKVLPKLSGVDLAFAEGVNAHFVSVFVACVSANYFEIFPMDFFYWLLLGVVLTCRRDSS